MLRRIFNFFAEIREERRRLQADYYANKSRESDAFSNDDLLKTIDREKLIEVGQVRRILRSISHRKEFHYSHYDATNYIQPTLDDLERQAERLMIDCWIGIYDPFMDHAIVKAGDFLDILEKHELPDGGDKVTAYSEEDTIIPVEAVFGDTPFDRWRREFNKKFPLATPSADVTYQKEETDHVLDIYRAMILAIGYAGDCTPHIRREQISQLRDITFQRDIAQQQRQNRKKTYRGNKHN